ncbi:hypothetical protein MC885_004274, partial [Smutsia gigantea]
MRADCYTPPSPGQTRQSISALPCCLRTLSHCCSSQQRPRDKRWQRSPLQLEKPSSEGRPVPLEEGPRLGRPPSKTQPLHQTNPASFLGPWKQENACQEKCKSHCERALTCQDSGANCLLLQPLATPRPPIPWLGLRASPVGLQVFQSGFQAIQQ